MNGYEMMGRTLEVCFAKEQRKRPEEMRRCVGDVCGVCGRPARLS